MQERALAGWRVQRQHDPVEITVLDSDGRWQARVVPAPLRWRRVTRALSLTDRVDHIERKAWREAGGSIPRHRRALMALPEGEPVTLRNGAPRGPLRAAGNTRVTVRGRRYAYRHTSPHSADICRDGEVIAAAVVDGRGWRRRPGAVRAAYGLGVGLDIVAVLDRTDELMVVVFTDVCGPPGRPGAVRRVYEGLKHELFNP